MSESIIMINPASQCEDRRMEELWKGEKCCRVTLDEYLDGRMDRAECGEEEEVCYMCERDRGVEDTRTVEEVGKEREEFA